MRTRGALWGALVAMGCRAHAPLASFQPTAPNGPAPTIPNVRSDWGGGAPAAGARLQPTAGAEGPVTFLPAGGSQPASNGPATPEASPEAPVRGRHHHRRHRAP